MMRTGLYGMMVTHRRLHPQAHRLRARIVSLLLDLDTLPTLARGLRFFSIGRANLVSFREADHGDGRASGLASWVRARLQEAGIAAPSGRILLLCMPRLLGRGFNPLSVYFCHDADDNLAAILYEVRNTFGQKHCYAVAAREARMLAHRAEKCFYVSPFMPMGMTYRFRIIRAGERLTVAIEGADAERVLIRAVMTGERREITDRALLLAALRSPLQGLRVLGAIHLHGALLWWKGARLHPRPAPPGHAVSPGIVGG